MSRNAGRESSPLPSLHGRRLKGKGKGILGVRETRRTLEEGGNPNLTLPLTLSLPPSLPPSFLARPYFLAPKTPFPLFFNACHAGYPLPALLVPERGARTGLWRRWRNNLKWPSQRVMILEMKEDFEETGTKFRKLRR